MKYEQLIKARKLDPRTQLLRLPAAERQAYMEEAGEALRRRFEACEAGFLALLDAIPTEVVDGERRTAPITIGHAVEVIEGFSYSGRWLARVSEENHSSRGDGRPEFRVLAWFDVQDESYAHGAAVGARPPSVNERFGNERAFSYVEQVGWNRDSLEEALRTYDDATKQAEETLDLLWDTVADEELNPGFWVPQQSAE